MKSSSAFVLAFLLGAVPAWAQRVGRPRRAPLVGAVQPFHGSVGVYHAYRVTGPYEGRVESVLVSPYQWAAKSDILALLASTELAAMLDASQTTPQDIIEKRWESVFKPTEVHCPYESCIVLSVHTASKAKLQTGDLVLVLAEALTVEADVRPPAAIDVAPGQVVEVWSPATAGKRMPAKVVEVKGRRSNGQARVVMLLPQGVERLKPGDPIDGEIPLARRERLLIVPQGAITTFQDRTFLNVEVQTGMNNGREVEILSGIDENSSFLVPAGVPYQEPDAAPPKKEQEEEE